MSGRLGPRTISSDDTTAPAVTIPGSLTALESYTAATAPVTAGNLCRVTDGIGGLWMGWGYQALSVVPWVDVAAYATGGKGTSGNPWTGWDTAITWASDIVYVARPGYFSAPGVTLTSLSRFKILGCGKATVFVNTQTGYTGADATVKSMFNVNAGSATALEVLTVQGDVGDTTITVADTTGFAEGDDISVHDSRYYEVNRITDITGGVITLARPLEYTYTIARGAQIDNYTWSRDFEIGNFRVTGTDGAGAGVLVLDGLDGYVHDVWTDGIGGRGILFANRTARCVVERIRHNGTGAQASEIGVETYIKTSHITLRDIISHNCPANGVSIHGFHQHAENVRAWGNSIGIHIDTAEDVTLVACRGLGNTSHGIHISGGTLHTTEATAVMLHACIGNGNGGNGLNYGTGGNCQVEVFGGQFDRNTGHGIYTNGVSVGSQQLGNKCRANGGYGIAFDGDSQRHTCVDNLFRDRTGDLNTLGDIGILGTLNFAVIQANQFANDPAIVGGYETNCRVVENMGWITQASGSATITSGNTTVVVTHGLDVTPTTNDIRLTASAWNNAAKVWVSDIGATTFQVNVNADPGVSGALFGWDVEVAP